MPPRNYVHTYVHDQLPGHSPNSPWWATPLGVLGAIALIMLLFGLSFWL